MWNSRTDVQHIFTPAFSTTAIIFLTLACLLIVNPFISTAESAQFENPVLEEALINEDWEIIVDQLPFGEIEQLSLIEKYISAHAHLAQNRNNEALCLFMVISNAEDLNPIDQWTADLLKKYPKNVVALYMRGDCLARIEQWEPSRDFFARALEVKPEYPMVLNARGVTFAAQGIYTKALVDFNKAVGLDSSFADAAYSRGAVKIQMEDGPEAAIEWFNRALHHSPDFVLALAGRGNAQFALGHWPEARGDYLEAQGNLACETGIIEESITALLDFMDGIDETELAMISSDDVGTTLDKRFNALKNDPSQWNTNRFISDLRGQPADVQNKYFDMVKSHSAQNQQWGGTVDARLGKIKDWNRPGGAGESWSSLIPKDIGIETPKIGGELGGFGTQDHQLKVTGQNYDTAEKMQSYMGNGFNNPMGGVTTAYSAAFMDDGAWPFEVTYGLFYKMNSHDEPVKLEEMKK